MGLHQRRSEKIRPRERACGQPILSHVPTHAQSAAKARDFSCAARLSTGETDSPLEEHGFEPSVPVTEYPGRERVRAGASSPGRTALRSPLPEPLGWNTERPVEARGGVLPCYDHRQLRYRVVVIEPLQAREQSVIDVAPRVRDRVGVFERHLFCFGEESGLSA